jgi:AAA domain
MTGFSRFKVNRSLLGARVFGGPLRVLLISAEDPIAEVALRVRAGMKHHQLTDSDVPGLHVIGADRWGISLLCPGAGGPMLNKAGWDQLTAELDRLEPDVLILDPLISVMGGTSQNDNAAAALFMGHLVGLAATRRIGVMVAHHAAKGRDPVSAESAIGAATFVTLSRVALGIEPLPSDDAGTLGLPPWEARDVFRVVGTKHNLSPPADTDRWFRLVSVEMKNAQPPTYPKGDKVGVVEVFRPGAGGPRFSLVMIRDALRAIDSATTPLSPSKRATARYAVPVIAQAIAPHRGGRASDVEAAAVLDHLIRTGLIKVDKVKLSRTGGRSDERDGLVLTSAGKQTLEAEERATLANHPRKPRNIPQCLYGMMRAGPLWCPRNAQGGMGEMRGEPSRERAAPRAHQTPQPATSRIRSLTPHWPLRLLTWIR